MARMTDENRLKGVEAAARKRAQERLDRALADVQRWGGRPRDEAQREELLRLAGKR